MLPDDLQNVFLSAASEVLETMFFSAVLDEESTEGEWPAVAAQLSFTGEPSGRFGVRVPLETGRGIANNFLGLDEASDGQVGEVICELANMLCGSVLSRMEASARFELGHPDLCQQPAECQPESSVGYTFGIDGGTVTMWLELTALGAGNGLYRGKPSLLRRN